MSMIEQTKQPDVVDLIIQAETVGFETEEEALVFVKAVVEAGVSSALPLGMGQEARRAYNEHKLHERNWLT
jgi:hypothetical protein